VEAAARDGRLWMIFNPEAPRRASFPEIFECLRALSCRPLIRHRVQGLEIVLYAPPSRPH
jgi:hypothetical protein